MAVRAVWDVDRSVVAPAFACFMVAAKMNAEGDAALKKRKHRKPGSVFVEGRERNASDNKRWPETCTILPYSCHSVIP